MAAPGTFTTLSANSTVTFSLGAVSGYYWTCANGSGDGLWAAFPSTSTFSTVNLTAGATVGYVWRCTNAGTGAGAWTSVSSLSSSGALSISNDTNITATLTGTSASALFTPITINLAWANTLATSRGGTNFNGSGLTLGDILYASSGTAFTRLAGNTTGNTRKFLVSTASGGVATAPTWDYLTGADLSGVSMNFTSIGFNMSPPSNAYISTTNRTGIAGANYQISLGGTYTAISSSTSIVDLDITTTHVSTTSALTTSAGLQITPNTNATSGGIISHYALLIGTGTNSGGTVITNYGIYNNIQPYAITNYGYYQAGTFTKASDVGLQLINTFTPTATANIRQLIVNPTFNTTSAILTSAYGYLGQSTFTTSTNNSTTLAEKYLNPTFTVSGAGIVTEADVLAVIPTINITTATTGTRITNMYGIKVQIGTTPTITTASTVLGTYYNIYSGTAPSLTGSGKYGTVYGGYFAAPLTTTADANTGSVALWADSLQVGGAVSGASTTGNITASAAITGLTLQCSTAISGLTQQPMTCYTKETWSATLTNSGGSPAQSISINLIFIRVGSLVMVQSSAATYGTTTMTGTISYFYLTTAIPTRYAPLYTGQRWPVTTRENATQYGYLEYNTFASNLTFAIYWYPNGARFAAGGGTAGVMIINPFCYSTS